MVIYYLCGMKCHRKVYSGTLCLLFLIFIVLYIDLHLQPQLDDPRHDKTKFYNVRNIHGENFVPTRSEGLNIKFINLFNWTNNRIVVSNTNMSFKPEVTTTTYKYENRSMEWPAIQTTKATTSVQFVRSKTHIVIVASYMRSGSTLTADIMQHFPKTLYVFEPFHQVVLRTQAGYPLHYMNGTVRTLNPKDITDEFLQNELMKWIECRFWDIDFSSLTDFFHAQFSRSMNKLYKCWRGKPKTIKVIGQCLPDAIERCRSAKHRLFKFIRLPMRVVRNIFHFYPNLQVIHLLRDPRGSLSSQIRVNKTKWEDIDDTSKEFCHRVADDLNTTLYLNYVFPKRAKILLYEKLAENPLEVAKRIYNYSNLPTYDYVLRYISKLTMEGKENGNPFGYFRKNSTKTAYNWRDSININDVQTIDKNCDNIYNFIGYQKFANTNDLQNHSLITLKTRNRPIYIAV